MLALWMCSTIAGSALDLGAVRAHLDATIPTRLADAGIEGVVVSIATRDGDVLAGGWGSADVEAGTPMDGEHTLVRIASLSKTFTATAVAKLQAQGRLDVDADVQAYLGGRRWPGVHDTPVTIRQLLAHTSGVINNNTGRVGTEAPPAPLAEFIAATMPPRVYPPGAGVLYSNHGNALAGLAVQVVTGTDFATWVEQQLLRPIGMDDTYYALDERTWPRLATSYVDDDDARVEQDYLHFGTVPASAVHTTAADMATYVRLHLSDGTIDGVRVLPAAAMASMREPAPGIDPALPQYHYAFFHGETAGHPTRSHGGSVPAFLSKIVLFDELGVGIFVCQNGFGTSITADVVDDFAAKFLPEPAPRDPAVIDDGRPTDPDALRGTYRAMTKMENPGFVRGRAVIFAPRLEVDTDDEGYLTVDGDRYARIGPRAFARRDEEGTRHVVAFSTDADGGAWVHRDATSAVREPWHATRWVQLPLYGMAFAILLAARLSPLFWRRLPKDTRWRTLPLSYLARFAALGVLGPHLWAAWVDRNQPDYLQPLRLGMPTWLVVVGWLPWLTLPIAIALAVLVVRRPGPAAITRLTIAMVVAIATLCALEVYWRTGPIGLVG